MKAASALIALALAGCATVPEANAGPTAGLGQIAYTNGLRVRPIAIVEDSRCPINAVCVWAGRLVVHVEIEGGAGADTADLTLGEPLNVGGTLTLVSAEPSKQTGAETDPRSYRFTFVYERTR